MGCAPSRRTMARQKRSSARASISSHSNERYKKDNMEDDKILRTQRVDRVMACKQDDGKRLREATPNLLRHLTKKRVIVPDLQMFQMVDLHARNTPRDMALTSDRLVIYLMSSCTSIVHTVRIFYTWIITNIRCDYSDSCHLMTWGFDPETVLRSRSASPVGMNLLLYHFYRRVCIPCSLIHGVVKLEQHKGCNLVNIKGKPNHAWVLVLIQRQWRFVDCACGSGFGEEAKDATLTREFFFLSDPEDLINSHFPLGITDDVDSDGHPETVELKETLQMLRQPLSFEQFCRQATLSVLGMSIGLELVSHSEHNVLLENAEQFSFKSAEISDLACVLTDTTDGTDCPYSVLCTRMTASEFRTVVKPPRPGVYGLSIFVKLDAWCGWPESFHRVVQYSLYAKTAELVFAPFPEHFGVWGANSKATHFGFSRRIFKFDVLMCRTGDLYVKLPVSKFSRVKAVISPAASDVYATADPNDGQASILSTLTMQTEGIVHLRGRFSEAGFYSVSLLSQNREVIQDAGTAFINVADFLVNCRRPSGYASPLPKSFPMAQRYCCLLEEPLSRSLVINRSYNFRILSPFLTMVRVDGEEMRISPRRSRVTSRSDGNEDNDDDSHSCEDNDRGKVWVLNFTPVNAGSSVYVYGSGNQTSNNGVKKFNKALSALFLFNVVAEGEGDVDLNLDTH